MQLQSCVYGTKSFLHHLLVLLFCSLLAQQSWALGIDEVSLVQAQKVFNGVTRVGEIEKEIRVRPAFADHRLLGYLFLTNEIAPIPAYSGKPVAVLIGMNLESQILGVDILAHEEPILVVGVTDSDLVAYTNQYHHQFAFDKVKVGAHNREGYVGIDGISGATITAMVLNRSIMRSAQRVSSYYGLPVVVTQNSGVPPSSLEVPADNVKSTTPVSTKLPLPLEKKESLVNNSAPIKGVEKAARQEVPVAIAPPDGLRSDKVTPVELKQQAHMAGQSQIGYGVSNNYVEEHWFDLEQIWQDKGLELSLILVALGVLLFILFFQDWLVVRTRLFRRIRLAYLLFTVFFIGYYCMAQLSIMNVLAFIQLLANEFTWETLMIDPLIFVLWGFVAVSIILWGRGVYCGWLCPFGAMQELIHKLGKTIGLKSYEFPKMVHERLWAIKYIILIVLVGVSLESLATAALIAEVEPFKTTLALRFQREWWFVLYAVVLLIISAFNSKFFCKYLCPLGAGLSFATRFRVFDWLRRRKECGRPCQTCASLCQISAIKHTGEIIDTECHYCLECQVDYWDDCLCPPLMEKRKKRERRTQRSEQQIAAQQLQ